TLGRFQNQSLVSLSTISSFCWYWGDGDSTCGDSITNTEWWNGPNGMGIVEHMYTKGGTFDGSLRVTTNFGCTETFTWKAAVANIVLNPIIIADKDSSCVPDNPVCFSLKDGPPQGASAWLWNFGDPPSGPANFNNQSWAPCHAYGTGPWMISLRIIAGPCDVTVYDTITKIGPGSTIEVPFDRVPEFEAYQCLITDSVHFPNNSAFYHNDPTQLDEDISTFYYDCTFEIEIDGSTGIKKIVYREYKEDKLGNQVTLEEQTNILDTVTQKGYKVYARSLGGLGTELIVIDPSGDTTFLQGVIPSYGINPRKRYLFNYTPPVGGGAGTGDQTAIPHPNPQTGYDPHVWRVWDMGDRFAPQCTTDSRPWVNKNVGINCNWTVDSNPVHWYTPWDEIYETFRGGRNYTRPYSKTELHKTTRQCYQIAVYPDSTMIVPKQIVITLPVDSARSFTFNGGAETINLTAGGGEERYNFPANGSFEELNVLVRRPPSCFVGTIVYYDAALDSFVAINIGDDTTYHNSYRLGVDNAIDGNGTTSWTVTYYDMEFYVPAGVTLTVEKLAAPGGGGAGNGTSRTITGPTTAIIEADEQFVLSAGDTLKTNYYYEEIDADTTYAQPSNYLEDVILFGIPTTVTRQKVFVDSALHREQYFLDNAQCFQVSLWHKDTVHDLQCESTGQKSLALIPPNADGMEISGGIPCPFTGDNLDYMLEFDLAETKPGCSQQWYAVNYDVLADSNNFIPFNQGLLQPPAPGAPYMPYLLAGSYGTKHLKGYTPGEIGSDPNLRTPKGSFSLGLIVGNGAPYSDTSWVTDPITGDTLTSQVTGLDSIIVVNYNAECLDTTWYTDMFRILYLNASFTIVVPDYDPKTICAGDTAFFQIDVPIQDSLRTLRWSWGYQGLAGLAKGPQFSYYIEEYHYYKPYTGPYPGRNDADVVYNGEDWLFNYVIRQTLDDVLGLQTIDTIVTSIMREWKTLADKSNADQIVKDLFETINLNFADIPAEDIPYYLGDGTFGCIDTTGLSQFFAFGTVPYSERVTTDVRDHGVFRNGRYRYRVDTTFVPADTILVAEILHFRDSSIQGFDTLEIDTNGDGNLDKVGGMWRHIYKYPKIVNTDPCDPAQRDTLYVNANGPMTPTLYLNNTDGCEQRGARLLNVGYLNDFWVDNENICNGLLVKLDDTLRYWQYGEQDPPTYPIYPFDYWHDAIRYQTNKEIYEVDWDENDGLGPIWERSLQFVSHIYDEPGEYTITVVPTDSTGCKDTTRLTVYVTDIEAKIDLSSGFLNCVSFVDFLDSTSIDDPCEARDTCPGLDLSCEEIVAWEWDFGDGTRKSLLQNPSHNYSKGGWFDVKLTVWSKLGCIDSTVKRIFIPGPQPEFEFKNAVWNDQDSAVICVGDSVQLRNISSGDKSDPKWEMRWGDGAITNPGDSGELFGHQYDSVGTFILYLIQEDEIPGTGVRCNRIFPDTNPDLVTLRQIKVVVLPRAEADLEISDTIVCPYETFSLTAHVDTIYTGYMWELGDGETISRNFPDSVINYSYSQSGVYQIKLIPDFNPPPFIPKCVDTAYGTVTVVDVVADFDIDSANAPNFCFNNTSTGATSYEWNVEDDPSNASYFEENICHNWDDRLGEWEVCLYATSAEGCIDTICKTIPNRFSKQIKVYNVFTPDVNDPLNKEFVIDADGLEYYNIKIFNRWGERVFESE
ncbi:MAG: PKD domain-containing protein, partial [Bacteroidia bacterium]|nr:PKD domain-containing protein [Bacteroidia bacterium]